MKIREADLGDLTPLGEGGFAEVFRAADFHLPGDPAPLAYKKFTSGHAEQARAAKASIVFRTKLTPAEQTELDTFTAWPKALVHDASGAICGLLMAEIPGDFFCRLADGDGQIVAKPREMGWLASSAAQRQAARIDLRDVDRTERMIMLAQLVYMIGRLHKYGWVFGDVSFKNVVFALDPPRIMLLDCDGAAELADTSRRQASTPNWDAPECPIQAPAGRPRRQALQDDVTDVYKLGLAMLRCLAPGKGASSTRKASRLHGDLEQAGIDIITRALSDDRSVRPTAKQVYIYLKQALADRIDPPEVTVARLVSPFLVRGQDARVEWRIDRAAEIEITHGNGGKITVDPAGHPHGFAFRADESGPVRLDVRNRFATVTIDLGELTLHELPPFTVDLNYLPRPQIPTLTAFQPPALAATLAGRPRIAVGNDVLTIPPLNVFEPVEALIPAAPAAMPALGIGDAAAETTRALRTVLARAGDDMGPLLHDIFKKRLLGQRPGGSGS
ncbi:hypothetical protein [Actinomadura formosensis]|uniref:hypothetical protein n=1 Tax=Actinomadura formosensis TaxID=60706 RepID=UPI003D91036B